MKEITIRKRDDVKTADGHELGQAMLIYRPVEEDDANLVDLLFVADHEGGREFFIPTDAIDVDNSETGCVVLSLDEGGIKSGGYDTQPDFVNNGAATEIPLAEEPNTALSEADEAATPDGDSR